MASLKKQFKEKFKIALETSDKWMAVCWVIEDGKIRLVTRTTCKFPRDDFLKAISQLADDLFEEAKGGGGEADAPKPDKLPPAGAFPKVFKAGDKGALFGRPLPSMPLAPPNRSMREGLVPKVVGPNSAEIDCSVPEVKSDVKCEEKNEDGIG